MFRTKIEETNQKINQLMTSAMATQAQQPNQFQGGANASQCALQGSTGKGEEKLQITHFAQQKTASQAFPGARQPQLGRDPDQILDDSREMNGLEDVDPETDMNLQHLLRATNHLKIA